MISRGVQCYPLRLPLPNPAHDIAPNLPRGRYATFPQLCPPCWIDSWGANMPHVERNAALMGGDWSQRHGHPVER